MYIYIFVEGTSMYRMMGFGKQCVTTPRITVHMLIVIYLPPLHPFTFPSRFLGPQLLFHRKCPSKYPISSLNVFPMFL